MIDIVFLDIDGVLTDGSVLIGPNGDEFKRIIFDDIDAIFEMKRAGLKIGFITGEDTPFCDFVKRRFSADFFVKGCKDKLAAFQDLVKTHSLKKESTCFVGDSKKDIALLKHVSFSYAPADVDDDVKQAAKEVLTARRGQGVVKEAAKRILKHL